MGSHKIKSYKIKERGKSVSVEILEDCLFHITRKRIGTNELVVVPFETIKSLRRDGNSVTVIAADESFTWKVANSARFVAEVNQAITAQ